MTLDELRALKDSGEFHHATWRTGPASGLHIYRRDPNGFRGFSHAGHFSDYATEEDKARANAAYEIVRNTGVSLGSYGQG